MKQSNLIVLFLFVYMSYTYSQEGNINVIYGDRHLFTLETPNNWINDREAAMTIGLTNFFYCIADKGKAKKSYMFANGIDKGNSNESLKDFVDGDINAFKKKYSEAIIKKFDISLSPPIINALGISFTNLNDRFKEEVIYLETDKSFIVLTFSADNEADYQKYSTVFESEFIDGFRYLGNDPTPFLKWQKENN